MPAVIFDSSYNELFIGIIDHSPEIYSKSRYNTLAMDITILLGIRPSRNLLRAPRVTSVVLARPVDADMSQVSSIISNPPPS